MPNICNAVTIGWISVRINIGFQLAVDPGHVQRTGQEGVFIIGFFVCRTVTKCTRISKPIKSWYSIGKNLPGYHTIFFSTCTCFIVFSTCNPFSSSCALAKPFVALTTSNKFDFCFLYKREKIDVTLYAYLQVVTVIKSNCLLLTLGI